MKLEYRQFGGMRPAVDERVLGSAEATDALDCDLRYQTVKPFLAPDPATLVDAPRIPLGYLAASIPEGAPVNHLHDILHNEGGAIPEGLYEVNERGTCIAASAVAQDAHERVYFSRPGGGMYDRGRTDAAGVPEERTVGVSAPVGDASVPEGDYIVTNVRTRADIDEERSFGSKWFWYVEVAEGNTTDPAGVGNIPNDPGTGQPARGAIPDSDMDDIVVEGPLGSPAFRYFYKKDNTAPDHVAPEADWPRADYHFILYSELTSQEAGRFIGTVYPGPSSRKGDTDAYVGGTIADAQMGIGEILSNPLYEYHDLYYSPAAAEYSHYRSYTFTYVTDRGEEGPPATPTDPEPVLPTEAVDLQIHVINAPSNASIVRIYRTETTESGTAFFFVQDVEFNELAEEIVYYTDLLLSVDLPGDTLQSTNWEAPPDDLKGLVLSTKNFYAGYVGSKLYLSEPFLAYAWPGDYAIDFTGDIRHISRYGDMLAVFTDREIALIVGNTPLEVRKVKCEGYEQLTSIYSTAEVDGVLYFATPTGIAAISGTNVAMATDEIVAERWWRDNIDVAEVRVAAFDNTIYLLSNLSGAQQLYRMGLRGDGGGFIRLGDLDVRDICTSSFFQGVAVLKTTEEDEYIFNTGAQGERTVIWRGRTEMADVPMAVISVRVLADDYTTPIKFRVYDEDGVNALPEPFELSSDKVRKLPVMRRGREWSFEVEAPTNIVSIEVGTSGRVR
jgi:hypothetical protein